MSFNFSGGEYGPSCDAKQALVGLSGRPRTLREQLQDRIAGYEAKVADLREAIEALTPEVERALNALQKL